MKRALPRNEKAGVNWMALSFLTLAFILAWLVIFNLDSTWRRKRTNSRMQGYADRVKANPDDKEALQKLIAHLDDSYQWARTTAAHRLGSLRDKAKDAVPALGRCLKSDNRYLRRAASQALLEIGQESRAAIPDLIEALKLGNESAGWYSAQALGLFTNDTKTIVPALIGCLKTYDLDHLYGDPGPQLAFEAANSLAKFGPDAKEAIPALRSGLVHTNIQLKFYFSSAIRAIDPHDEESLQTLVDFLDHPWMDSLALTTLGDLGTNSSPAIPAVKGYLNRKLSPSARQHAEFTLIKISGQSQ